MAITASTGDDGYGVGFPASSQFVTAVGGTTLTVNANNTYGARPYGAAPARAARPSRPSPPGSTDTAAARSGLIADVAADADPNTGAAVYDSVTYQGQSGWFQVGGTSLASPMIATTYALAGNTSTNSNGATPYISGNTGDLHDVRPARTAAADQHLPLQRTPGYDGPTGVGTPDGVGAFSPTAPTPDFSLSVSGQGGGTITSGTGGSATYTVTVNDLNGFAGSVSLSTPSLPSGITSSFPTSTASTAQLTLTVSGSVAPGSYTIPITGTAGALTHTANASLTVASARPPGFSLAISPSSQSVGTSGSVKYTVTTTAVNGFNSSVSFSVSGLPHNVSGSFSPSSIVGGSGVSTLTVT